RKSLARRKGALQAPPALAAETTKPWRLIFALCPHSNTAARREFLSERLQPAAGFFERLAHALGRGAAGNGAARDACFGGQQRQGAFVEQWRVVLQVLQRAVLRLFSGAEAFKHQFTHDVMRL